KLRYFSFVNRRRTDVELAKSLRAKFEPDPVLIIGNWTPGMARYHEPIRGKGLQEMLIGQGFTVCLIDEYCTSTFCPACKSRMEKFHKIDDPRLKNPKHKHHNCDMVAALNFHIILNALLTSERPPRF
ncbi:hypothetical protein BX661DRAFT_130575, partial [Kickxella alabastrina]|uniref:uncharacterized protein n=1 Tax=Kickxella alabastrina TaxID=61397 RepID=UPI00221E6DEF